MYQNQLLKAKLNERSPSPTVSILCPKLNNYLGGPEDLSIEIVPLILFFLFYI